MTLEVRATYEPGNSPKGTRCAVKVPGGEFQSHSEGGTDGPYDDGGEGGG